MSSTANGSTGEPAAGNDPVQIGRIAAAHDHRDAVTLGEAGSGWIDWH